jgi:hypothetical protein
MVDDIVLLVALIKKTEVANTTEPSGLLNKSSGMINAMEILLSTAAVSNVSLLQPKGPLWHTSGMNGNMLGVAQKSSQILYPLAAQAGKFAKKLGILGIAVDTVDTSLVLLRTSATSVEKGAAVAKYSTGILLVGVGAVVSAPAALSIGVAYFAFDAIFDVNSLYKRAINSFSNLFRREEYDF